MIIAIVDGLGGGIGAQIVTQLRQGLPLEVEILALGTNAIATEKMMEEHAHPRRFPEHSYLEAPIERRRAGTSLLQKRKEGETYTFQTVS